MKEFVIPETTVSVDRICWFVDQSSYFKGDLYLSGWAFHPQATLSIFYRGQDRQLIEVKHGTFLPSLDVVTMYGESASNCRFNFKIPCENASIAQDTQVIFALPNGEQLTLTVQELGQRKLANDPFHVILPKFLQHLNGSISHSFQAPKILEIGSRNRSGVVRRSLFPGFEYVGLDILEGENVDIVGDAHELSKLFPPHSFNAIFSTSTFEHLLMPWKVVLEMNQVLAPGGFAFVSTHQTWALHESPWDFWRFSDQAWHGLFNRATGFEVIETTMGEAVSLVPNILHSVTAGLEEQPAYLGSAVIARKMSEIRSHLSWEVGVREIVETSYPQQQA